MGTIRAATPQDAAAIAAIAVDSTLFGPDDVEVVTGMMAAYFDGRQAEGHGCVVLDGDDGPRAVAYFEPAEVTDRTWYLTMIAVRRAHQGSGLGGRLMHHVEDDLRRRGERLLLVETSGTPAFDATRNFYRGLGYREEARVRDYYADGDDMVVFRRALGD